MRTCIKAVSGTLLLFFFCSGAACAQDAWTLQQCVAYALEHNISIQQNVLNERLAGLVVRQSRYSQIPNVYASGAAGRSFGRSVDPTTNQFVNASYNFLSLSGNADVLLFGWFQKRRLISQGKFSLEAARQDLDQLQDDVSLNVATGFLRAVLAREQIRINEKQVELSAAQLNQTRRFAEAGRVPELDVAQLESQIATDSANLIGAIAEYNASLLDLKALLNLDFSVSFDIQPPDLDVAEQVSLGGLSPEEIYQAARRRFGSVKSSELRVYAAEKGLAAAKSSRWPQLGLNFQSGTNYASTYREVTGYVDGGPQQTGSYVDVNGNVYPVYQPLLIPQVSNTPLGKQLGNNFRQTVSLSLTVPLFNGWQAQYNTRKAKIDMLSQILNKTQAELTLRQNVYKAYNDAVNSAQKYNAAKRAAVAAGRAYDFAQKRYDLGLTNTIEYLITQNNLYRADANLASARYDLVFRMKVIDYYQGRELKL